jgi:hypothetical protein
VRGPDGAPYVLDRSTKTVYRIDLKAKKATVVARLGQKANGATVATPKLLTVGGQDLLILDSKNVLWRWRPSDTTGKGTLVRISVAGSASWGTDISGIATFLKDSSQGLYNLYVIDPSEQQIRAYSPRFDGGGFPANSTSWLATARPVDGITSIFVDGDLFLTESGVAKRLFSGSDTGWKPAAIGDDLLHTAPSFSIAVGPVTVSSGMLVPIKSRTGSVYLYDKPNQRVIEYDKSSGDYRAQYQLAGDAPDWSDLRGMAVTPGVDTGPATLIWIGPDGVHQSILEAVVDDGSSASPSPSPSISPAPTATPKATPKVTPKPTKKP